MAHLKTLISVLVSLLLASSKTVDANCFGGQKDLHPDVLRSYRAQVDPVSMGQVYEVVERRLQTKVHSNDLDANLRLVMSLLRAEIDQPSSGGLACFGIGGARPLMSRGFDRNVTINALIRLNDLKKIVRSGLACSAPNTNHLIENNLIAKDPIGRRLRSGPSLLPRIDSLIFDLGQRRAEHCLPKYKELLTRIYNLETNRNIKNFWDGIFQRRLQRADFDGGDRRVDSVFQNKPSEALSFFDGMQDAVQLDEMDIILKYLSDASAKSSFKFPYDGTDPNIRKFDKFVRVPCTNFVDTNSNLLQSFEFDMQFKPYLSVQALSLVDNDPLIYRLRAYFAMCKKLLKDKYRFVELLNRQSEAAN